MARRSTEERLPESWRRLGEEAVHRGAAGVLELQEQRRG